MSGIDTTHIYGRVQVFYASLIPVAHNATVGKYFHGPLRAVITGVEHQPSRVEGGLSV